MGFIKPKCYVVIAYLPEELSTSKANRAFNELVGDSGIGLVLYHDHFVGTPGGIAIVYAESADSFDKLVSNDALEG